MRKHVLFIIIMCMVLFANSTVYAAESNDSLAPVTVLIGIMTDDNVFYDENKGTDAPTTFAPSYWYGLNHSWSAKTYTYSAYKFTNSDGLYLTIIGQNSYNVSAGRF